MQITLEQTEIESAIHGYIVDQGLNLTSIEPRITFTAGRGTTGLSASIELIKLSVTNKKTPITEIVSNGDKEEIDNTPLPVTSDTLEEENDVFTEEGDNFIEDTSVDTLFAS